MTTNPQTIKITLDGPMASGKTLLIRHLFEFLKTDGIEVLSQSTKENDQHEFSIRLTDADRERLGWRDR